MFKGSIVALVTPFHDDGKLDEERLRFLINWHIKNKTDAILICGTTGESATLTYAEHKRVISIAVEEAKGKFPVIAGAGSNSTHESLELASYAKEVKADAILVITPYYNKPTQEGLYQHYSLIAKRINLPLIIYNVPSRTGINILPTTVAKLYKEHKNIVGIKEASGSLDQITQLMSLVDRKFILFSGSDEITLPILSVGGRGVVSVLANIMPRQTHNLVHKFLEGDWEEAKRLQLGLYELIKALFMETNPIPVKTALGLMGMITPKLRLPLCEMNEASKLKLEEVLKKYKLL
ncbi:MAG: 4-hydroxy-tetrahydrodipicolinate synthase [Candidatus Omnitrophica bacterium]|nr:4-hydroxy-tetrahydrodipicolinate synthase [Candidatus Omnitrophota bacterium]MCM8825945.1 4-hydroxy-tetrahydrodipicolinate synthase [Candidatus Omnitrophota bacterium]